MSEQKFIFGDQKQLGNRTKQHDFVACAFQKIILQEEESIHEQSLDFWRNLSNRESYDGIIFGLNFPDLRKKKIALLLLLSKHEPTTFTLLVLKFT